MGRRPAGSIQHVGYVPAPSENKVQEALFEFLETVRVANRGPALVKVEGAMVFYDAPTLWDFSYAVPNGSMLAGTPGQRAKYMAALKRRGLKPGVSDVVIAWPVAHYHGMYLELKKDRSSRVTQDQLVWREKMQYAGYCAMIAVGLDQAIAAVRTYMATKKAVP